MIINKYNGYFYIVRCYLAKGNLCGYVLVDEEEVNSVDITESLDVHGGISYQESLDQFERDFLGDYLEILLPEESGNYVIGFDCFHGCDMIPAYVNKYHGEALKKWRDFEYVEKECKQLIDQLEKKEMEYNKGVK